MKHYADLTPSERVEPCIEYPGKWYIYINGKENCMTSKEAAFELARINSDADKVSICWEASDDDPRIGKTWFTNFYRLCIKNG